jgi:hypothetical protein
MGSGLQRTINVEKMRATDMDGSIKDLVFGQNGVEVQ